jgi:predicted CxxxxCH...CXXCH cytochrome family protein
MQLKRSNTYCHNGNHESNKLDLMHIKWPRNVQRSCTTAADMQGMMSSGSGVTMPEITVLTQLISSTWIQDTMYACSESTRNQQITTATRQSENRCGHT